MTIQQQLTDICTRTGLSRVAAARRLRTAKASQIRQILPLIESPDEADAERFAREQLLSHRTLLIKDDGQYAVAADGTYQLLTTDPYRGLKAVAAGEVLGLTRTHSVVEVKRGMITVTLIQPSRRDADSLRLAVVHELIGACNDGDFHARGKRLRATRAEKALADRVRALQHVGDRTADDWDIRRRVGVTISEIRSK